MVELNAVSHEAVLLYIKILIYIFLRNNHAHARDWERDGRDTTQLSTCKKQKMAWVASA